MRWPSSRNSSFSPVISPNGLVSPMLPLLMGVILIAYSPSAGNSCCTRHAAARAEWHALDVVILRGVFRHTIGRLRRRGYVADRQTADLARGRSVAFQQRGRQGERAGDIVEAARRIVRWQIAGRDQYPAPAGRGWHSCIRSGSAGAVRAAEGSWRRACPVRFQGRR